VAYWAFRTPAEVIKTQVQTGQSPSVLVALKAIKHSLGQGQSQGGNGGKSLFNLWKYYPVMLNLDVPFQIMNFILYGVVSDAVVAAGFAPSIWTRLFCGTSCGMVWF
jgi:hypothetical protein